MLCSCMHACMVACGCLLHTMQAQELQEKLRQDQDLHDSMLASRLHAVAMQTQDAHLARPWIVDLFPDIISVVF